jgi:predicted acylesterase/phospholipase RssA
MEDSEKSFGLCLSGGGFRATLYHLGVIKFLRDAGALKDVTHIFSVSGGSILAAHLVLNWEKYTGSEEDFEAMAEQVIRLTKSDVRGRVIRKWILSWLWIIFRPTLWLSKKFSLLKKVNWKITRLLDRIYSEFYRYKDEQGRWREATLANLRRTNSEDFPDLHILSASVTTGRLCSFNKSGFSFSDGIEKPEKIPTARFPISTAVAASSAFPPVFSPVALTGEMIQADQDMFPHTEYLTDGGVYDNLGIRRLLLLEEEENFKFDKIFLSDAGTAFDSKLDEPFSFILTLSIRASNLLMMRVGNLEYNGLKKIKPDETSRVAICRIQDEIEDEDIKNNIKHPLDIDTQRALQGIRTDLNTFNSWEINVLAQHGYAIARKVYHKAKFGTDNLQILEKEVWIPKTTKDDWNPDYNLDYFKERSRKRKLDLVSARDLNSWLSVGILAVIALIPFLPSAYLTVNNAELASDKKEAEDERNKVVKELLVVDPNNKIFSKYKAAIVKIDFQTTANQSTGSLTGFLVSQAGHILTVKLPEAVNAKLTVTLADGTPRPVKLIDAASSENFVLLKVDANETFQFLNFSQDEPVNGDSIIGAGFIGGSAVSSEVGIITGRTEKFIMIRFEKDDNSAKFTTSGLPGGPIMDLGGKVVGVYYNADRVSPEQSSRYCIPAADAVRYLSDSGVVL